MPSPITRAHGGIIYARSLPGVAAAAAAAATIVGLGIWCYRFNIVEWVREVVVPVLPWLHDSHHEENSVPPSALPSHVEREIRKEERRRRLLPLLTRTKPMYDNILLQDSMGNPLATISMKKAKWYINKDLADWVVGVTDPNPSDKKNHSDASTNNGDNHFRNQTSNATSTSTTSTSPQHQSILRLRFQPKNSHTNFQKDNEYNISTKNNQCVVCGRGEHYNRHYVRRQYSKQRYHTITHITHEHVSISFYPPLFPLCTLLGSTLLLSNSFPRCV
jgi:hypothetical protein